MSMSEITATKTTETTSGLFAEAVGGIGTVVLSIIALHGTSSEFLLAIATIVFGAALLIEGTSIATDYAHVLATAPRGAGTQVGTGGLATVFLAGITGIILGVLALLGTASVVLTSAAMIIFGSALLLSSASTLNLHRLKAQMSGEAMAGDGVFGTAGAQALAGIGAIVLGILAVAGTASMTLSLVALLVLGAAILATGNGMNNAMIGMFHVSSRAAR